MRIRKFIKRGKFMKETELIYKGLLARQVLFVEDGSVDLDELKTALSI